MDCEICVLPFNKSSRAKIKCPFCKARACVACNKLYLQKITPECMYCHKEWSSTFVYQSLGKEYYTNTTLVNANNDLFILESTILPRLQQSRTIGKSNFAKLTIEKVKQTKLEAELKITKTKLKQQKLKIAELESIAITTNSKNNSAGQRKKLSALAAKVESGNVVVCLQCVGFLDPDTFVCGLCGAKRCKDCLEPILTDSTQKINPSDAVIIALKELGLAEESKQIQTITIQDEHKCDANNALTIDKIRQSYRLCPACGIATERISGCAHMTCGSCASEWNWNTRKITRQADNQINNPAVRERRSKVDFESVMIAQALSNTNISDFIGAIVAIRDMQSQYKTKTTAQRKTYVTNRHKWRIQLLDQDITGDEYMTFVKNTEHKIRQNNEILNALANLDKIGKPILKKITSGKSLTIDSITAAVNKWNRGRLAFNGDVKIISLVFGDTHKIPTITDQHKLESRGKKRKMTQKMHKTQIRR